MNKQEIFLSSYNTGTVMSQLFLETWVHISSANASDLRLTRPIWFKSIRSDSLSTRVLWALLICCTSSEGLKQVGVRTGSPLVFHPQTGCGERCLSPHPRAGAGQLSPLFLPSQEGVIDGEIAWTEAKNKGVTIKSYGFCWDGSPLRNSFYLL